MMLGWRLLSFVLVGVVGPFPGRTLAEEIYTPSPSADSPPPSEAYYYDYAGSAAPTPMSKRCNLTAYEKFYNKPFDAEITTIGKPEDNFRLAGAYFEPWFWGIIETRFDEAYALTQGVVMEQAHSRCQKALYQLTKDLSGRQGPMKDWFYWQAMCTTFCLDSDTIHEAALAASGCLCTELSVTDDDAADDDQVGDLFCRRNSARMLCDIHGLCGVWDCPMEDFMCPRYEYNRQFVFAPNGGKMGDCITSDAVQLGVSWTLAALTGLATVAFSIRGPSLL